MVGARGIGTVLCGVLTIPDPNPFPKWEGVSLINNIEMKTEEMKVWRAYDVGDGKNLPYSKRGLNFRHSPRLSTSPAPMSDSVQSRQENVMSPKSKARSHPPTKRVVTQTRILFSHAQKMDV